MNRPECKHPRTEVIDSRHTELGIRRRRECLDCGHRWSTLEVPAKRLESLLRIESAVVAIQEVREA